MSPLPRVPRLSTAKLLKRLAQVAPREPKVTVGLDIGSTSVKVIALGPRKGPIARPVMGQSLIPVEDPQQADASGAIRQAVDTLRLPVKAVNLSVSGPWVILRVVELPTISPAEMKQALPFEAQRYLPFSLQDVFLDGMVLGPAGSNKVWVLIVACKKELIERRLDWVKRAGLEAGLIDVDALALTNGFLASRDGHQAEAALALINVGAQLTNLVVLRGRLPYLVRDIPWGAEKLYRNLAEQVNVEAASVSQAFISRAVRPEWQAALKVACEALATELQLSFDYFENRFGQPPQEVLVSGGLGQSTELLEALKGYFAQAVAPWSPVSGLSGQFAVAYGLALRID